MRVEFLAHRATAPQDSYWTPIGLAVKLVAVKLVLELAPGRPRSEMPVRVRAVSRHIGRVLPCQVLVRSPQPAGLVSADRDRRIDSPVF